MEENDPRNITIESILEMDKEAWAALSDDSKKLYISMFIQIFLYDKGISYTVALDVIANLLLNLYRDGKLSPDGVDAHLKGMGVAYRMVEDGNKSKE